VEFLLLMTIGETGDAFDDPTIPWPARRVRVTMGTLTLTKVAADQSADCEKISFNPCRLVPGIALSNDPILAARRDAYEVSREMRGGTQCPFAAGPR
jgi:catalase